jgi:hypothetical protein
MGITRLLLLAGLALGWGLVAPQPSQAAELEVFSSNVEARAPARYGFVLPRAVLASLPAHQALQLVFAADLDVDAYQRLLQLCYLSDRAGRRPARSHCVESIPARISVKAGPGEDRVTLEPQHKLDASRATAAWVDLINPSEPGLYAVVLWSGGKRLGQWTVRVEYPSYDGPSSGD